MFDKFQEEKLIHLN